jgi:hypothetical protein
MFLQSPFATSMMLKTLQVTRVKAVACGHDVHSASAEREHVAILHVMQDAGKNADKSLCG